MEDTWNHEFKGIGLRFPEKIIQVDNDTVLDEFLKSEKKAAYELAAFIKEKYTELHEKELQIRTDSLAIEIIMHYKVEKLFLRLEKMFGQHKFTRKILLHTHIIDCGEKSIDSNRFIWDIMAKCRRVFVRK